VEIKTLIKSDESRWDQFVKDCDSSTIFHKIRFNNLAERIIKNFGKMRRNIGEKKRKSFELEQYKVINGWHTIF
jgi:hypothetical protein